MSKTIRLEDNVYEKLTGLMRAKETYSELVERLLLIYEKLGVLTSQIEGNARYLESVAAKLEREKAAHG